MHLDMIRQFHWYPSSTSPRALLQLSYVQHRQQMETQRMLQVTMPVCLLPPLTMSLQDFMNENRELKEEVRLLRKDLYQLRSGY